MGKRIPFTSAKILATHCEVPCFQPKWKSGREGGMVDVSKHAVYAYAYNTRRCSCWSGSGKWRLEAKAGAPSITRGGGVLNYSSIVRHIKRFEREGMGGGGGREKEREREEKGAGRGAGGGGEGNNTIVTSAKSYPYNVRKNVENV